MLKRFITEGIKNVTRSIWLSATAIMVLTVSLTSVTLIIGLSVTIGFTVRNLDTLVSFPAFFKENVVEEQIKNTIIPNIKSLPNIKNVEYFDKEKARKALDTGAAATLVSQLKQDENQSWRYIQITPDKSENYKSTNLSVKEGKYKDVFQEVLNNQEGIDNIIKFYGWTTFVSIGMVVIFGLISVLVMSNILRMTIYNHRDEIEIMRLVGATNNYIRGPFVAQGIIYNVISAIIVVGLFVSIVGFFTPPLKTFLGISSLSNGNGADLISQIYLSLFLTMGASIGLGILTVYASIQKYLKY